MKKCRIWILLAFVLLDAAASTASHGQVDDFGGPIKKALTQYDDAWNKKDVDAVSHILAADYVYFSSTGGLTTRKATLAFLASPDYKLTFVERS